MTVFVSDTRETMGKLAGKQIAETVRTLLTKKDNVNMIFAAAPSQNETLDALCSEPEIDWSRIYAFHMDEYIGLGQDAPQGFGNFLRKALFSRLPFGKVFYLDSAAADIASECRRYTALLKQYPVDITVLGIGENGHIAFNDPWAANFADPETVKEVRLDPVCRKQQVDDGCFSSLEQVPERALTLTIPALTAAKYMFCSVPSKTKTEAVTKTVYGEISEKVPASVMRLHPHAVLYCDAESGKNL